jgi:hypothetical protein
VGEVPIQVRAQKHWVRQLTTVAAGAGGFSFNVAAAVVVARWGVGPTSRRPLPAGLWRTIGWVAAGVMGRRGVGKGVGSEEWLGWGRPTVDGWEQVAGKTGAPTAAPRGYTGASLIKTWGWASWWREIQKIVEDTFEEWGWKMSSNVAAPNGAPDAGRQDGERVRGNAPLSEPYGRGSLGV